jgi:hypothetical protein
MTKHERAARLAAKALAPLPKDATAQAMNRHLRDLVRVKGHPPYSRSTWRRAVRLVQGDRAKVVEWEGGDPHLVRPIRRRP